MPPIVFHTKKTTPPAGEIPPEAGTDQGPGPTGEHQPPENGAAPAPAAAAPSGAPSWMQTGHAAAAEANRERARHEARREAADGMRRFFISAKEVGKPFQITFLDGDLAEPDPKLGQDQEQALAQPFWYEHELKLGPNDFKKVVCLEATDGVCPLCEQGNSPSYVGALTILDHRTIKTQKGPVTDERKLFIFKQGTHAKLLKLARKHGGLRGLRVEVERSKDQRAPRVGDDFVAEAKYEMAELRDLFDPDGSKGVLEPADYIKEAPNVTAAQLAEAGIIAAPTEGGGATGGTAPKGGGSDDIPF